MSTAIKTVMKVLGFQQVAIPADDKCPARA